MSTILRYVKLSENAFPPEKATPFSAGYDLRSAHDFQIPARDKVCVKTDLQLQLPAGSYGRIAMRSSIALNKFIGVGGGVIDADFRGNVCVIMFNFSNQLLTFCKGDKIAQLIVERIYHPTLCQAIKLPPTERGSRGFGSSDNSSVLPYSRPVAKPRIFVPPTSILQREFIVDMQTFRDNHANFVIKEIAIVSRNPEESVTNITILPPYEFEKLDEDVQIYNQWLKDNLHGIEWNEGILKFDLAVHLLKKMTVNATKVYVKGAQKKYALEWLLGKNIVVDISPICPRAKDLPENADFEKCLVIDAHKPTNTTQTYYACAKNHVQKFKKWLNDLKFNAEPTTSSSFSSNTPGPQSGNLLRTMLTVPIATTVTVEEPTNSGATTSNTTSTAGSITTVANIQNPECTQCSQVFYRRHFHKKFDQVGQQGRIDAHIDLTE